MGHLIGYARVSTADQDLSLQLEALRHAGCRDAWIFRDITSGNNGASAGPGYDLVTGRGSWTG